LRVIVCPKMHTKVIYHTSKEPQINAI